MVDIIGTLQSERDRLSRSEQRIADILIDDVSFAVNASIVDLAAKAEVSPPTVTRFCRRLGCASFSEFKVRLAQSTFVGVRYLDRTSDERSSTDIAENIISKAQTALHALHQSLDYQYLDTIAEIISKAGMIYAFGSGGGSSVIADEFQHRLFRLGFNITSQKDHQMQLMMAASAREGDVLIASSISGRNVPLVESVNIAREYKVGTIALTRPGTPLAEAAEYVIPIDLPEGLDIFRPSSTRYAYLAVADILAQMVAQLTEDRAVETLRRIKHQLVSKRDEDDREMLGD
ncbi:MAG: MurR/RpiR family transcriptional regulator [Cohaesibacteraceae bacterium]|nr:MurR/RpiR family transcriptional regulator [Cohaesibacteraceae bacterium]MBL4875273.1 MurR/RpiR family transcriptional regulator [Cohaesibacteraceae bacterium]